MRDVEVVTRLLFKDSRYRHVMHYTGQSATGANGRVVQELHQSIWWNEKEVFSLFTVGDGH